ncbi:uncharacterized protein CDAR_280901 [Caerostris darwini]|uniref:Uncharacterized protein n=1 Tax=Caerostris darwini TaxID=1538125 RepID=A0AAV4VUA6_9ARAC|nr:uncharacterized protein CDAR_280901 [Caerostris darwini]
MDCKQKHSFPNTKFPGLLLLPLWAEPTSRVHVEAAPENPYGLELVFEDVKYEDRGTYVCSAIIDGREAKTHFMLTVYRTCPITSTK